LNKGEFERFVDQLKFDAQGLVPGIVQDGTTGEVLMVAYMNRESLERTFATRDAHFWSRSRGVLWHKGETSGNRMAVKQMRIDCDGDCVLMRVDPSGPACHTGNRSCFYRTVNLADGTLTET